MKNIFRINLWTKHTNCKLHLRKPSNKGRRTDLRGIYKLRVFDFIFKLTNSN